MILEEFPTIRIDDFRVNSNEPTPELCLLTHMHEDHTAGLSRKTYFGPVIYCTACTRALLLNFRSHAGTGTLKYGHLRKEVCGKELVKPLALDTATVFDMRDGSQVSVTAIDANHCPGAVMFLIEANNGPAILYTGDLRCEKWHLNALSHNPNLLPYLASLKGGRPLSIYLDDTFAQHINPHKEYIENSAGIQILGKLLNSYPPEVHFCLAENVTGHEEVLIALAELLNTKIHMNTYYYNLYHCAADHSPLASKLLEYCVLSLDESKLTTQNAGQESTSVRLHFCQKNMACPMREPHAPMAYFKPCNQPPQNVIDRQNAQYSVATVPPGIMEPFEENPQVVKGPDQRYYRCEKTKKYYPLFPWFYFSRHASMPEVMALCSLLKVSSIRSLSGTLLAVSAPITSGTTSVEPSAGAKRVTSFAEGLVQGKDPLPILAKKPKMMRYRDRVLQQKRRERAIKNSKMGESTDSESNSDDDAERHNAMMMLNQTNEDSDATKRKADNTGSDIPIEHGHHQKGNSSNNTNNKDALKSRALSTEYEADSSSMPSPPMSPSDGKSSQELCPNFIDETPEDPQTGFVQNLVLKLRADPDHWFDIRPSLT